MIAQFFSIYGKTSRFVLGSWKSSHDEFSLVFLLYLQKCNGLLGYADVMEELQTVLKIIFKYCWQILEFGEGTAMTYMHI